MNVVVCVKQVVDVQSRIKIVGEDSINSAELPCVANPLDLVAVEEAIRLKEQGGVDEVMAISVGPLSAEDILRRCLAMGADRALLLCDAAFDDSEGYATAVILARAIGPLDYGLILCGQRSADTEVGLVGYYLADMLGIPVVSGAVGIEVALGSGTVRVYRKLAKGDREVLETPLPALVAVEEGLNEPRYVSRRAVMAAERIGIERHGAESLDLSVGEVGKMGSKTTTISFSRLKPKRVFVPDSSLPALERLEQVISGGAEHKTGSVIRGSPGEMASQVVDFLATRIPSI